MCWNCHGEDPILAWAKDRLWSAAYFAYTLYGETWRTRWVAEWIWEKRATSAECKTIRIAESSDMDSWKELLWPCASFKKIWVLKEKMKWEMFLTPIPTDRYEVVGWKWSMMDLGWKKEEFWVKQIKWWFLYKWLWNFSYLLQQRYRDVLNKN